MAGYDVILIDSNAAKILGLLDPEAVRTLLDRSDVAVSPAVAARLTGRSIPAIRAAVDRAELQASGRTHRKIQLPNLAAWCGTRLPLEQFTGAFGRITSKTRPAPPALGGPHGYRASQRD
jgi:hypothetical protein